MIDDELLISAVQSWHGLWHKDSEYRHVRSYIKNAWDDVAKEVGAEAHDCKKRWIRLRDYFVRITRQKKTAKEQGVPFHKKKWYLYEQLLFLLPVISTNDDKRGVMKSITGDDEILDNEGEEIVYENGDHSLENEGHSYESGDCSPAVSFLSEDSNTNPASSTTTTYKTARNKRKRKTSVDMSFTRSNIKEGDDSIDDANELFFKSLLPSMNKLNDIEVMEFRIEVQSLLLKYLLRSGQQQSQSSQESASTSGLVTSVYCGAKEGNLATSSDVKLHHDEDDNA